MRWPRFSSASFHPCTVAGHSLPRAQCPRVRIKSLEESTLWGGARGAVSGGGRVLSSLYAAVRCTIQNSPRNSDRSFSRNSPCTRAWFLNVPRRRKCSAMSLSTLHMPLSPTSVSASVRTGEAKFGQQDPLALAPRLTALKATLWESRSHSKLISNQNAASQSSFITNLS